MGSFRAGAGRRNLASLFVENSPISEATRGVVAVLDAFDLPTDGPDLEEARSFFRAQRVESHVLKVLEMGGGEFGGDDQ